jgi:hypothetical protein
MKTRLHLILFLLIVLPLNAQNYIILQDALSEGGGKSISTNYILHHLTGQTVVGISSSVNYIESGGFLFFNLSESGIEEEKGEETEIPSSVYFLHQNHPNPMIDRTTIRYGLPEGIKVSLKVYDNTGRMVRTLIKGFQLPGYYAIEWDGRGAKGELLPSGIYFYRLETKEYKNTRKLILLR